MRRRTNEAPIGGACDWSFVSSAAKSAGTASGMVVSICATFMSGPFIEPSADASALASLSRPPPRKRLTPTLAANVPALTPSRA
jgi:hypothetical protein